MPARAAATGSVEGTVTDAESGTPLAGVRVEVDGATTTTDAQGSFALDGLSLGTHAIVFRDASGRAVNESVTVSPESPERIAIAVSFGAEVVRVLEKAPAPPVTQPLLESGDTVRRLPRSAELIDSNRAAVVLLMTTVDTAGTVADARVMTSPGLALDDIAIAQARTLRFSPALDAEGKPTLSHVIVKVEWEPYWSRLMGETWGAPCQGEGPLNLGLPNPTYRACDTL